MHFSLHIVTSILRLTICYDSTLVTRLLVEIWRLKLGFCKFCDPFCTSVLMWLPYGFRAFMRSPCVRDAFKMRSACGRHAVGMRFSNDSHWWWERTRKYLLLCRLKLRHHQWRIKFHRMTVTKQTSCWTRAPELKSSINTIMKEYI